MNNRLLNEALNHIRDKHLEEAILPVRKPFRFPWIGFIAAVLAAAIVLSAFHSLMPTPPATGIVPKIPLAEPVYPEMPEYPNVNSLFYEEEYDLWRTALRAQRNQPEGYADGLEAYFQTVTAQLLGNSGAENAVCSPLNIYMALSLLAESTGGNSRQQILELLGADSMDSLRIQAGHVWNAHYRSDGIVSSVLANSLWLKDSVAYNRDTVALLAQHYYASVYRGDLGSAEMNAIVRDWLNAQTGGLLEDQIRDLELNPDTVLALASTVYYRAQWADSFRPHNNTQDLFYAPDGTVTATFMHRSADDDYYWGEDYSAISLRLEEDGRMWLILPDEGKTVEDVLARGEAMDMVLTGRDWHNRQFGTIHLSLPRFDVVSDTDLREHLQALGITDVFSPQQADFTPILPEEAVFLSQARHAARVKIDEEGVEAAAYTVFDAPTGAPPQDWEEIDFVLDRPFIFVIASSDNLPLFAGVVNQP